MELQLGTRGTRGYTCHTWVWSFNREPPGQSNPGVPSYTLQLLQGTLHLTCSRTQRRSMVLLLPHLQNFCFHAKLAHPAHPWWKEPGLITTFEKEHAIAPAYSPQPARASAIHPILHHRAQT